MRIIVDSCKIAPYSFTNPRYAGTHIERSSLETGTYSLVGLCDKIAVECKTLDDLMSTLSFEPEQFEQQLGRSKALELFAIVIEGTLNQIANHQYKSQIHPNLVLQRLMTYIVRYGTHIVWAENRQRGELITYTLLQNFQAESQKRYACAVNAGAKDWSQGITS